MPPDGIETSTVPPLRHGDRLTRADFERRFDATPNLKLAELVDGVVSIDPPQTLTYDAGPSFQVIGLLGGYQLNTPATIASARGHIRLGDGDMYQPNAVLCLDPAAGGSIHISDDDYLEGAPELVIEIVSGGAGELLEKKLRVYRRSGVRECLVWRTRDGAVEYLVLQGERFSQMLPDAEGIVKSTVFPGLWWSPPCLIAGDYRGAARVAERGLGSAEHGEFVGRLAVH